MGPIRIGVSTALALCVAGGCFAQPPRPCFAWLLRGDVFVDCEGKKTQITRRGDIEEFAASIENSTFAYTVSRITGHKADVTESTYSTTVINLKSGAATNIDGMSGVTSMCGGLFSAIPRGVDHPRVRSVVSGEELTFQPYVWFRCDSGRKTVVGTTKNPGGELYEGVPPKTKIAGPGTFNAYQFNLSPDGTQVAYHEAGTLCVFSSPGPAQCVEAGTLAGSPSVNDAGEVLVGAGTGQECFYKTFYDFFPERPASVGHAGRDECLGIGYWKPGATSIEAVEPLGRNPQWIDPATAGRLREWAARQHR